MKDSDEDFPIYFALKNRRQTERDLNSPEAMAEREAKEFYERLRERHYLFRRKMRACGLWPKKGKHDRQR